MYRLRIEACLLLAVLAACRDAAQPTAPRGVPIRADVLPAAPIGAGYGPNLFYYLRHDPSANNFSTFGTISTSGAVTDRFGVGLGLEELTSELQAHHDVACRLSCLRHDPGAHDFSTFRAISSTGVPSTTFFGCLGADVLPAAPVGAGYGPNLFYYLRHDPSANNFSTFGTISTSGAVTDRFGVGP